MNDERDHGEPVVKGLPAGPATTIDLYFNWQDGEWTEVKHISGSGTMECHFDVNQINPDNYKPKANLIIDVLHQYEQEQAHKPEENHQPADKPIEDMVTLVAYLAQKYDISRAETCHLLRATATHIHEALAAEDYIESAIAGREEELHHLYDCQSQEEPGSTEFLISKADILGVNRAVKALHKEKDRILTWDIDRFPLLDCTLDCPLKELLGIP